MKLFNSPERAVQFGRSVDMGMGPNKAFPFVYSLVNRGDDTWEENKSSNTMDSIGPLVPAGRTIERAVRLTEDFNFKLLQARYSVYWYDSQNTQYLWYDPIAGWSGWLEQGDPQTVIGTPLTRYLEISFSVHGPNGRYIYGGSNANMWDGRGDLTPMQINSMQGNEYGVQTMRIEAFLPYNAIIKLRITNTHDVKDLYLAAALIGMKVRL